MNKKLIFCLLTLIALFSCLFYFSYTQRSKCITQLPLEKQRVYPTESPLSEKDAFIMVYGNYNATRKGALWKNMRLPSNEEFDDSWKKSKAFAVSEVFFKPFEEAGKKKIFFITKTIPTSEPYECHACLPLINATVFVKNKEKWEIESQNLFLMQEGEYAQSPITNLIQVGLDRYGVTLEFEHRNGEFLAKILYLIIPYKKSIKNALEETIYYDNFNGCGRSIQCATFFASLDFSKTSKDGFYLLKIKRFGTNDDEKQHYRAVPIDEESTYQFRKGKYVQINWKGYPKIDYEKPLE